MSAHFRHYPSQPSNKECEKAFSILCMTHATCSSFLDIFEQARIHRQAKGASTDKEQDLLRAMLAFSCSGLDSMVKQLINDALPSVIDFNEGANEAFKAAIEKRINKREKIDHKLIAEMLCDKNPRKRLIDTLLRELASNSLQSTEEIFRVGKFFDIPSRDIYKKPEYLSEVFRARNEIVHEMDIDFNQPNRSRRPRAKLEMIEFTNKIFCASNNFIAEVDNKLEKGRK